MSEKNAPGHDSGSEALTETPEVPAEKRKLSRAALLEREGEIAADFLERLLDIADLDGDIDVDIDGDRAQLKVVTATRATEGLMALVGKETWMSDAEDAEALIGQGRAGAFQSLVKRGVDLHAHAEVGQGVLLL